ncbi:alpha/beta hydrolase domain-containing protein [Bradyrhizobium japonicum]|nr:alpha/beta hydrolase domain-containing protein [Bradyrhizobium japonicum]MEB2674370.1 alpha/beta hydrolase domain-containing protein [Bradyrhizobium japonicum]WLB32798.1 alpha/beta hydrolase domain-containing protein [Bradyrhizobium japonicum]WRJ96553.1 alpha/beta hydrolase domain-containing protein [Bradyrhizobium japonicum]WRK43109.1 alpha/beta hydrolase domain-containing protein [Bradyrhizobium japonicum]
MLEAGRYPLWRIPMPHRRSGRIVMFLFGLFSLISTARPVSAEVTRIEFTSKQPYGTFRAGDYVIWQGKIRGDLSPQEAIPGVDKAPRNERGRVDYAAKIILMMPAALRGENGALLVDVPNRGQVWAEAIYNSPRDVRFLPGTLEQGTGFLQDHGFAVAEVFWELGQGADLPSFADVDGKTRFVEGVGFAIVRDAADFFAHAASDKDGTPNPLKGAINRVLASGRSQDGRFLKTFLLNGFNMMGNRRVFDGMHVFVSAAGLLPILQTGLGPMSSAEGAPTFDKPDFPGVNDGPLTIGEITAKVEARGEVPPRMILVNSTTDYYSLRASLGRTGASGTADQPLPANVRMYDIAGGPHVPAPKAPACTLPPGRLDWSPLSRALLLHLDAWASRGTEPPASELMSLEAAGGEPPALRAPSRLSSAVIQVPKRDQDGNALGGVRLPDIAVPTGTNGAQNQPQTFTCMLIGSFSPFAATKAERERTGDARPSIEERYHGRDDYVNRVRIAAQDLLARGFLLPDDAAVIVQEAASTNLFAPAPTNAEPR